MKIVITTCMVILFSVQISAQKYTTKTGTLKFEASTPSFEEVVGENKSTSAVLDVGKGDIAVLSLVKGFRFKVALMEEHFNENYVESDKFPKATFTGKIQDFDAAKLSTTSQTYTISGDLTLHGVTKKVSSSAKISKSGNSISIIGNFSVKPSDFAIEVPGTVSKKVAKEAKISYNFLVTK